MPHFRSQLSKFLAISLLIVASFVVAILLAPNAAASTAQSAILADASPVIPIPWSTNPASSLSNSTFTLTLVSDTSTEYLTGTQWLPSVLAWTYGGWPSLNDAAWIWKSYMVSTEEACNGTGIITFRRKFSLPQDARNLSGNISITADNAYELSLNGTLIGSDDIWESIETYQLNVRPGENELSHWSQKLHWILQSFTKSRWCALPRKYQLRAGRCCYDLWTDN